jgi:dihydropteroate synthase
LKTEPRLLLLTSEREAVEELKRIGSDPYGIQSMAPKMAHFNLLLEKIECRAANILKQEMLSIGGDVAVARGSVSCSVDCTDALIIGTRKQVLSLAERLSAQPFGLKEISSNLKKAIASITRSSFGINTPRRSIQIGGRTLIMGILNVTPDSFSDGGRYVLPADAVGKALKMEDEGADIIDIGGESSRPGSERVSVEEELDRIIPVIEKLSGRIAAPISVDSMKAQVAREAVRAGAEIVNDISSMQYDPAMPETVASLGVPVVLMHMRGQPETMQKGDLEYSSLRGEIIGYLRERMESAAQSGVDPEKIIIDPGFGFGKSLEDNLRLVKYLGEFKILGRPLLVGTSRKAFTARVTGAQDSVRLEGSAAAAAAAVLNGANIIRVHDVGFMKRVALMADAILRA